jgi:hypothetical protein
VVRALPPIPQSPLSTSSTTHQVTPRMLSPSIETIAQMPIVDLSLDSSRFTVVEAYDRLD